MKINLQETCIKQTITRENGEKINKMIITAWEKDNKVIIDFNNVLIASVSFLDEAFGKLAFDYPKEYFRNKLHLINIEEYDKRLLNDILTSRYHQKELGQNGPSRSNKK